MLSVTRTPAITPTLKLAFAHAKANPFPGGRTLMSPLVTPRNTLIYSPIITPQASSIMSPMTPRAGPGFFSYSQAMCAHSMIPPTPPLIVPTHGRSTEDYPFPPSYEAGSSSTAFRGLPDRIGSLRPKAGLRRSKTMFSFGEPSPTPYTTASTSSGPVEDFQGCLKTPRSEAGPCRNQRKPRAKLRIDLTPTIIQKKRHESNKTMLRSFSGLSLAPSSDGGDHFETIDIKMKSVKGRVSTPFAVADRLQWIAEDMAPEC